MTLERSMTRSDPLNAIADRNDDSVMAMTRRTLMGGALCGAMVVAAPATAGATPSLARLASARGLLFGTSISAGLSGSLTGMLDDSRMMDIVDRQSSVIVAENEMKQYVVARRPDSYDFAPGDRIARWAQARGKTMRGHTLLWNHTKYTPAWLVERYADAPADALATWLRSYVGAVVDHYGDRVHAWDVVNETIDPATGALRDSLFQNKLGFEALRIAYETAKERVPGVRRVYNDYMSWGDGSAKHRAGVLALLRRFRDEGVPVDALGLQSHIGTAQSATGSGGDFSGSQAREREWRAFLDEVTGMGYRLSITEFDVSDQTFNGSIERRDKEVAAVAKGYLDLTLSYRVVDEFLCWGLVDRYSWLQGFSPRKDGEPLRPLPFDSNYRMKPLGLAIADAIKSAPYRDAAG